MISNVTFDPSTAPDLDHRKGGEVDEEVLRKVFTELDFVVSVHRNLTAQVRPTPSAVMIIRIIRVIIIEHIFYHQRLLLSGFFYPVFRIQHCNMDP